MVEGVSEGGARYASIEAMAATADGETTASSTIETVCDESDVVAVESAPESEWSGDGGDGSTMVGV